MLGIVSIVLGVLSLLFALGGFLTTVVPGVGLVLSFASPVLAIAGIVCGGIETSRARADGYTSGSGTAGLILSIVAFFPAFLVAVSCGFCNLMCTGAMLSPRRDGSTPWYLIDGGPLSVPPTVPPFAPPAPGAIDPNADPNALPNAIDPNADPNAVDPNADPNAVDPHADPNADPNAPLPSGPNAPPVGPTPSAPTPPRPPGTPPPAFPPPPLP